MRLREISSVLQNRDGLIGKGSLNLGRNQHRPMGESRGVEWGVLETGKEKTALALIPAYPVYIIAGFDDMITTSTLGDRGPRHPPPATGLIMIMYFFPPLSP